MQHEFTADSRHKFTLEELRHVYSVSAAYSYHIENLEKEGLGHRAQEKFERRIASWDTAPQVIIVPKILPVLKVLDEFVEATDTAVDAIVDDSELSKKRRKELIAGRYRLARNVVELGMELEFVTFADDYPVLPSFNHAALDELPTGEIVISDSESPDQAN